MPRRDFDLPENPKTRAKAEASAALRTACLEVIRDTRPMFLFYAAQDVAKRLGCKLDVADDALHRLAMDGVIAPELTPERRYYVVGDAP